MIKNKSYDAVKMMRRIRDRLSRKIEGMTPEQEINYFRQKAARFEADRKRIEKTNGQLEPQLR
jgi:hypothetical protein